MPQFTKTPPAPTTSAAREGLAALIETRNGVSAAIERIDVALSRLIAAQEIDSSLRGALAALDAAESAAMSTWARSGAGDAPLPDVATRDELNRKIGDAQAKASSARRAEGGLRAEAERERAKIEPLDLALNEAAAEVLAEQVIDLIPALLETQRAASAGADRILAGRDLVLALAHAAPEALARPIFITLEKLNTRLESTFTRVAPEDLAAKSRADWSALIGRLHLDATATLESQA